MGATRRLASLLVVAWAMLPAPAGAADPVPDAPFAVGADVLFTDARNDRRQGPRGRWQLEAGRLDADAIRLQVVIEPPPHGLPVESGPAVLFGGLSLFGDAGGDVGLGLRVDALTRVTLPPCDDAACRYIAEVAIPTADLGPAIRRLEQDGSLMWASADLTLVRTFGGGSWLQVLPFYPGGEGGPLDASGGRLGAIQPVDGTLFNFGLFPATEATPVPGGILGSGEPLDYARVVEGLRAATGDPTTPLEMAPGRLRAAIAPACEHAAYLVMHDDAGDWIFHVDAFGLAPIDEPIQLPVGVPWRLIVGTIDFDQDPAGWGIRVGPIASGGTPIVVDAVFNCSEATGALRVTGGVVQPTAAPSIPAAVTDQNAGRGALGGTAVGLLAIIVIFVLIALLGIGSRQRRPRA